MTGARVVVGRGLTPPSGAAILVTIARRGKLLGVQVTMGCSTPIGAVLAALTNGSGE